MLAGMSFATPTEGRPLAIVGARVVAPEGEVDGALVLTDGRVAAVGGAAPAGAAVVEADGLVALPGFLDLHVHGGGGGDVMDATPRALRALLVTHARHGT